MAQPSVIARLMGIDAIPMPVNKAAAEETKVLSSPRSAPFKQAKCSLLSYRSSRTGDAKRYLKKMRVLGGRSRARQPHPQEHLLQKIKEDFQSWQASKAAAALGNSSKHCLDGRCIQIIAQENLRKEKMARYGYKRDTQKATVLGAEVKSEEKSIIRCAASEEHFRDSEVGKNGNNQSMSKESARIVLLKPRSDVVDAGDGELLFGLSKMKRDDNMEKFLQEVKERLQKELKVKRATDLSTVYWGIGPNHDTATQLKHAAATADLGKRLSRSQAFRVFTSDRKRNHATVTGAKDTSPEHVKISTRNVNLLVQRTKDVTPRTGTLSPKKDDEVDSFPIRSRARVRPPTDMSFGECLTVENTTDILPQRKLVRSFSAPESAASQIRLFLDESVGSRNHGTSDIASESGAMTSRASSFSFTETVLRVRHRFSFRGKLFRRKKRPSFEDLYPQLPIGMSTSPSESFGLYNFPQANFAELPTSPVSPSGIVGHSSRHFFSDLNCSLAELSSNRPWEFEAPATATVSELSFRTDITVETACNQDKAYLREVLIAAGLYDDGSLDNNKADARVDSMARPIWGYIFYEVEDMYCYRSDKNSGGENATDHRMLFDLANEALQILVQGAKTGSSLCQWVIDSTGVSRGRKLVDDVWQQVQAMRYPQMQEMQTIDSMVAFEVRKSIWADLLYEDVYVVGRKIERAVFDELIQDLLLEISNS